MSRSTRKTFTSWRATVASWPRPFQLAWLRSLRPGAISIFIRNRSTNVLDRTDSASKAIESFLQLAVGLGVTSVIPWDIGVSSLPPTVFIRDLCIPHHTHMDEFA